MKPQTPPVKWLIGTLGCSVFSWSIAQSVAPPEDKLVYSAGAFFLTFASMTVTGAPALLYHLTNKPRMSYEDPAEAARRRQRAGLIAGFALSVVSMTGAAVCDKVWCEDYGKRKTEILNTPKMPEKNPVVPELQLRQN